MFDLKTQKSLKLILDYLNLNLSPIFNSIRVPLAITLSERENKRHSKVDFLIDFFSNLAFLFKSLFSRKTNLKSFGAENSKFIFVIDHNREPLIKIFLELMDEIPAEEVHIVTVNKSIFKKLKSNYPNRITYINELSNIGFRQLNDCRRIVQGIKKIDPVLSAFEKFSIFTSLLKVISYERIYKSILSSKYKSVVTLCDANLNEQIISRVASNKHIKTFTLQHGMVNKLWFPIVSDQFFVWNEQTKRVCHQQYKVDESKMLISGNPFFEPKIISKKQRDVFTVTYVVTNWGEKENKELFKVFLKISQFEGIRLIIKLRPNPPFKMLSMYKSWAGKIAQKNNIDILYQENISEILEETDLVVTFNSGVPVDALAYGVPSILLDIFKDISLEDLVGHYEDCTVVFDEQSYIDKVYKILNDEAYYRELVEQTNHVVDKYFSCQTKKDAVAFIRSKIVG